MSSAPSTQWSVAAAPEFTISGNDPQAPLTNVAGVVLMDSLLVIAHADGPPAVQAFRLDGRPLWSVGGEGDGPGELRVVARLWAGPSGAVTAYDPAAGRLTVLDVDDGAATVARLDWIQTGGLGAIIRGPLDDHRLVGAPNAGLPPGTRGSGRTRQPLYLLDTERRTWDTLTVAPRLDYYTDAHGRPARPIFGRSSVVGSGGGRVFLGMADSFVVTEMDDRGREVRADALPAYDRILVTHDDTVWVRSFFAPGDGREVWSVFDDERRWVAEVEMPPGLRMLAVHGGSVAGTTEDTFGVPSVHVHRLVR